MTDNGKIQLLPGIKWTAGAALASAYESMTDDAPVFVAWLNEQGEMQYRTANLNRAQAAFIGTKCVRIAHDDDEHDDSEATDDR